PKILRFAQDLNWIFAAPAPHVACALPLHLRSFAALRMQPQVLWGNEDFTSRLAEVTWMAAAPVLLHLNERATGDPMRDWLSEWAPRFFKQTTMRVLVL